MATQPGVRKVVSSDTTVKIIQGPEGPRGSMRY
jgi:hypothetical protein